MTTNQQRILDISKKLKLSHIGSNLSCLPILEEIYSKKKPEDKVLLDGGHAHLAHEVVKSNYYELSVIEATLDLHIEHLINDYGIHCDRKHGCDASSGSLGHMGGVAIGYALADRNIDVYWIITDGSSMEGSTYEALRIIDHLKLTNIKIHCNFNGYSAVQEVDIDTLTSRLKVFNRSIRIHHTSNGEGFDGVQGHYETIK